MSANLRLEGHSLELVKDLFHSDVKALPKHSDEIFKTFDGIALKGVAFLLIELISFSTSAFVTLLKHNKFREVFLPILFLTSKMLG